MKDYQYYLFDADGTLFDTADLICRCFGYLAENYANTTIARESIINSIGMPLKEQIRMFLGAELVRDDVLQDYLQYQLSILDQYIQVFPGVADTLARLKAGGKTLAVVTSRRRYSLEVILQSTATARFFDLLITPEDTARHKPDPEPPLKAMELLGAPKERTVFIGDAQYDVCSGADAGIDTVFVGWSRVAASALPVQPTWTIERMEQLLA